VPEKFEAPLEVVEVAQRLAQSLDSEGVDYSIGGAIALGYWAQPRGTLDVDVTIYLPPSQPTGCVRLLQTIGCEVKSQEAIESLTQHGFCQVEFGQRRVDVFLPVVPFYEQARLRRQRVSLNHQALMIWDAATLCVFKMMFFRRKDLADVEQILRVQGNALDRLWVAQRLIELYGSHDPRVSEWQSLVNEIR
jgi:hypothetical protein